MDKPIQDAVDIAIATVTHNEFKRLRSKTLKKGSHVDVVQSVAESLQSLDKLRGSGMPDYDNEWVALLYPAWYQPRQVNIVCSVLRTFRDNGAAIDVAKQWDGDIFRIADGRAHFIDFGCGSLAMQFAVAIAAADSISQGQSVSEIRIDSYDPNPGMFKVGKRIWDEFVRRMKRHCPEHPICQVFDLIQCETHDDLDTLPKATDAMDAPRFLSAIHAVYKTTKGPVKDALESLVSEYNPVGFLFTTQGHKTNWDLLHSASPIGEGAVYARIRIFNPNLELEARFDGELDALTKRRKWIRDSLIAKQTLQPVPGIVSSFLSGAVEWRWPHPDPAVLLYMRKDISEFTG